MEQRAVRDNGLELAEARGILIFATAEILDVATTLVGLRTGTLREGNPIAAGVLSISFELSLALKLLVVVAVMLMTRRFISARRRPAVFLIMATIAVAAPLLNSAHLLAGG